MYPLHSKYTAASFYHSYQHIREFELCVYIGACNQHLVSEPSAREEDGVAVLRVGLVKTV
ncbi:hypothetical protein HanRHA438_Chr13g0622401 [Helianthus annuus]|nr:hypothetical protein HanRHA438_Chr13g0622401 [Helianthus annuus]